MTKIDNNGEKKDSLPISCLNMHNLSIRVFIECPEAWVWQYIPGKRPLASRKKMSHNFNLTYLVHFMCYLYLLTIQSALTTFPKPIRYVHANWMDAIERFNITCCLEKKKRTIAGAGCYSWEGLSKGFWGLFFYFLFYFFCFHSFFFLEVYKQGPVKKRGVLDPQTKRSSRQEDGWECGEGSGGGARWEKKKKT